MSGSPPRKLGRGLAALLGEAPAQEGVLGARSNADIAYFNPSQIIVGRYQPRTHFDQNQIDELAQSIQTQGILHPLLVRVTQEHECELVAGERRLRAAQQVGLTEVPCRILTTTPAEAFEVSLLENIQRATLSALEEARGFKKLMAVYGHTQEALAERLGKSRSYVANALRLLTLPEEVHTLLDTQQLSAGHARALLAFQDPVAGARQVIENAWSVRQTEQHARDKQGVQAGTPKAVRAGQLPAGDSEAPSETAALAHHLTSLTGMSVSIVMKKRDGGRGQLVFSFEDAGALDRLLQKVTDAYTPS